MNPRTASRPVSRRTLALALAGGLLVTALTGCTSAADDAASASAEASSNTEETSTATAVELQSTLGQTPDEVLADNLDHTGTAALTQQTRDTATEVAVSLDGDTATADGSGVTVDGATVTITAPGTYRLTGSLDGQVVVDSADDGVVRLVLDDAEITSSTTAAVAVMDADQVSVVLPDGSASSLTDATDYEYADGEDEPNAALYSTADLAISGGGSLTVTGRSNDGIGAKDGLVIAADVTVEAVDDGIRGKDYLVVTGGTLDVEAGGDGLKADNEEDATAGYVALLGGSVTIAAGDDGVDATSDLVVDGESLVVTSSTEGLEAFAVTLASGTVDVTATDDGVNAAGGTTTEGSGQAPGEMPYGPAEEQAPSRADDQPATGELEETPASTTTGVATTSTVATTATVEASSATTAAPPAGSGSGRGTAGGRPSGGGMPGEAGGNQSLTILGGTISIDAGGDGLDSNGSLAMTGGDVVVHGPTDNSNGALDVAGDFTVDGGTLLALGSAGMAQSPDTASTQGWVATRLTGAVAAGSTIEVLDADGTVVVSTTTAKETASVVLSSPLLTGDGQYTVTADGTVVATATAGATTSRR